MKNERFEEYFVKYKNLIMRLVMNKTGDYQTAQEICQQVFTSFYANMDRISPDLVKAWLIRSTQNAIVDHLRKNKVKERFLSIPLLRSRATFWSKRVWNFMKKDAINVNWPDVFSEK